MLPLAQHITDRINHCAVTGEEGLAPTALNARQVQAQAGFPFASWPGVGTCPCPLAHGVQNMNWEHLQSLIPPLGYRELSLGCNFHSPSCFPELQCPGPREVQGGNWHLFSSQRLCKIGVKATARKQKIKQALQHTSHCFPRSITRHSSAIRLMQLKSSFLITATVTKMGRSLDIRPG